jgi:hypothetical protein
MKHTWPFRLHEAVQYTDRSKITQQYTIKEMQCIEHCATTENCIVIKVLIEDTRGYLKWVLSDDINKIQPRQL